MKFVSYFKGDLKLAKDSIKEIKKILLGSKCKLIGSAGIPVLGKKEFDILVVVKNVKISFKKLEKLGFKGIIIKNKAYMCKKINDFIIELHLVKPKSKMIKIYGEYIKLLKRNPKIREGYERLKKSSETLSEKEYKKRKSKFIENNLLK